MEQSPSPSIDPSLREMVAKTWSVLRREGYADTRCLPYFRSLSRLPSEPTDLCRYFWGTRKAHRSAWPALYYLFFRAGRRELFDLFRCFSLGHAIKRSRLDRAAGKADADFLVSSGFLRLDGERVSPAVRVYLRENGVFFHDAPGTEVRLEQRVYMGRDSLRFADYLKSRLLPGRRFRRVLDLGTGCGVQAIVLAPHSEEVVAVDTNDRALAFAQANASINEVDNVRFGRSDLAARVSGRFDLVVSNPPFLYLPRPSPLGRDVASDGGLLGIGLSRRILAGLADLLTPDGEARILVSIPRTPRGPIMERWIKEHLLPEGLDVRLRFVEYLWCDGQADAYRLRGIKTPALVVAEVRRSSRPRLRITRAPASEKLILARKIMGERAERGRRKAGAATKSARPARLRRALPLTLACAARTTRVPAPPHQLMIESCTACPLDCISCARAERVTEERFMDPGDFKRALDTVRPWSVQFIGNGDPLCHPEIDNLCASARERVAQVVMQTAMPAESVLPSAERALPHLDRLYVGIDAANPDTYAAIRRGGDFQALLAMLRRLYCLRRRSNHTSMFFTFLLLERNYAEAPEFVRFSYRTGADGVLFLPLDLRSIESREHVLLGNLDAQTLRKTLTVARERAAAIGISTNLDYLLSSPALLLSRYGGDKPRQRSRCVRPWLYSYVTVDGDVLPCPRFAYHPSASLGNLFRQSFQKEIWNGEGYRRLRADLNSARPNLADCRDCAVPSEEGGLRARLMRRRSLK